VPADEDPFEFYTRSTTTRDEDRAHGNFSTALADKEEGEKNLSQTSSPKRCMSESPSETSSPTSEPSSTESDDEGEHASCATHSPIYSPCPSLSDEPDESEKEYALPERKVEYSSWNPTPQWGTEYNWTQEYRENEKRIADEWAVAAVARKRERRDESMSGGASPRRKETADKKKFLDGINDPHGELRAWECPAAVEEREEAKKGKVSMNITSPHGYRTKQIQITQKYPKDEAEREQHPHAWPVELAVTWAPLEGSAGNDMVSTLEIDPKELKKGGSLTWTGEAADDKARTAENRDDSRQSSSVEPEKPTNKRARKGGKEARTKTSEEVDWDDHLMNQEMDLR
jgi:hypothetical protein